jgi:hypothetical protein
MIATWLLRSWLCARPSATGECHPPASFEGLAPSLLRPHLSRVVHATVNVT